MCQRLICLPLTITQMKCQTTFMAVEGSVCDQWFWCLVVWTWIQFIHGRENNSDIVSNNWLDGEYNWRFVLSDIVSISIL